MFCHWQQVWLFVWGFFFFFHFLKEAHSSNSSLCKEGKTNSVVYRTLKWWRITAPWLAAILTPESGVPSVTAFKLCWKISQNKRSCSSACRLSVLFSPVRLMEKGELSGGGNFPVFLFLMLMLRLGKKPKEWHFSHFWGRASAIGTMKNFGR